MILDSRISTWFPDSSSEFKWFLKSSVWFGIVADPLVWPRIKCEAIKATQARHCLLLKAGRNGLAAPVLAGPVFLKVKIKFQKPSNKQKY